LQETEFLTLIRENQGIIYKLVGLYARTEEEKKDFSQEIILQAWKGWPSFRREAKFSTWLYRISLNTLLTMQRKKKLIDYREDLETIPWSSHPDEGNSEDAKRLYKAIRALPETEKAMISLHLDGYANQEVSEIIGISENHVAVKLHRIKSFLKQQLSD
jgi:RNA polymerase sigma-70 factor (ECF subfamily)